MKAIDVSGERFGALVAIERTVLRGRTAWVCQCDCGGTTTVRLSNLRSGNTSSCGCRRVKANKNRAAENKVIVDGDEARIILVGRDGEIRAEAVIDAADVWVVRGYRWALGGNGYVIGSRGRSRVLLHRFLLDVPSGVLVDHRDRDPLNNRRENIRLSDATGNMANSVSRGKTSRFKGVYFKRNSGKWAASVQCHGEVMWLGYFETEEDAARAYNEKAVEVFGEFARPNDV